MAFTYGVRINGVPQLGSAAVTSIAGTANQITASAATGVVTLSIPSAFIAPGSIAATTTVSGTTGTFTISLISPAWIPAGGTASVTGTLNASVGINSSGYIGFTGSTFTTAPADGFFKIAQSDNGHGIQVDVTTDNTAWFKGRATATDIAIIKANVLTSTNTVSLVTTTGTLTDNAGAGAGTLLNAPSAGNPTKWIRIIDNGTARFIPTWT